ncbi:hypothetical protein [Dethiobacter alkaliphilus]|uniref:Uncharacterized protein n=1 Tax=Dethiobacter alkaliphilus AHT 1 TaxID=555088 RepID=C0GGJ8_DETAL|nr:hypothetical protein [Dethiobacter alkaliphilus]EEG77439.1 hypothetical protein DealDRAFT_1562 [Dethiobacter alkaliphilus AHT 1]
MVTWSCPHCKFRMHSITDLRDTENITCLICEEKIPNPHYRRETFNPPPYIFAPR